VVDMPRLTFEQLCKPGTGSGYVLETGRVIKSKNITDAVQMTSENIDELLGEIVRSFGRDIDNFYIGKSHVREQFHAKFNPEEPRTWRLDNGVNSRYRDHVKKNRCKEGLVVVAVVTKDSIKNDCRRDGYYTHQEDYALRLEKMLIQKYERSGLWRLSNRGTDPGGTDKTESRGYLIYICFVLKSKYGVLSYAISRETTARAHNI
jgi:hypothetical protein